MLIANYHQKQNTDDAEYLVSIKNNSKFDQMMALDKKSEDNQSDFN